MAGFKRSILEAVAGKKAEKEYSRAEIRRVKAMLRLERAISDLVYAWEAEDEAYWKIYHSEKTRIWAYEEVNSPAEYLRIVADAIDDSESEEA